MKTMKSNDLGKKFLVEECQKVSISTFLKSTKEKLKNELLRIEAEIQGNHIELTTSKTGFGGIRYWFKCLNCSRRVGTLFMHPISQKIGCRGCLELEYRKIRYKGMVENSFN